MPVTSCEPPGLVVDSDGDIGQRRRVLPVVVRAEQQVLAGAEQDADAGLSATAVAAARGVHRPGYGRGSPGCCFIALGVLGPAPGP